MKKKKQSCAANRHKCRPVFLIEQELREAMNDAASCLRNRNYARHQQAMQRIAHLKKELEDSRIDQQFHDDNRNMDRAERAFSVRSCTCRSTRPTWRSIISRCFCLLQRPGLQARPRMGTPQGRADPCHQGLS